MLQAKLTFCFVCLLLLVPQLCFAAQPIVNVIESDSLLIEYPLVEAVKLNTSKTFNFHIINKSNGLPITSGITCYFQVYNSSGNHKYTYETSAVAHIFDYELNLNQDNFTQVTTMAILAQCNNSAVGSGPVRLYFEVTPSGSINDDNLQSVIFIVLLMGFVFYLLMFSSTLEDEYFSLKWFFRLLSFVMLFVVLVGSNMVLNSSFGYANLIPLFDIDIYQIVFFCVFAIFLVWILYVIFSAFKKKKDEEFERGII